MKSPRAAILLLPLLLLVPGSVPAPEEIGPIQAALTEIDREAGTGRIDKGSADGVILKMRFRVYSAGEVIYLPLTGEPVVQLPEPAGYLEVIEIQERHALVRILPREGQAESIRPGCVAIGHPIVVRPNLPPRIRTLAADPAAAPAGAVVTLRAEAIDPDGDPLAYRWSVDGGRAAADRTLRPETEWTLPFAPGTEATVTLTVSDGKETVSETLRIAVGPYDERRFRTRFGRHHAIGAPLPWGGLSDLVADGQNRLAGIDPRGRQVVRLSADGTPLGAFGTRGRDPGQFGNPLRIDSAHGKFYVLDVGRKRVIAFSTSADAAFAPPEFGDETREPSGRLSRPVDVAVAPNADVLVLETDPVSVVAFAPDGRFLMRFGAQGETEGHLLEPTAIGCDPIGRTYVLDAGRDRLLRFGADRRFEREWGAGDAVDFTLTPAGDAAYLASSPPVRILKLPLSDGVDGAGFSRTWNAGPAFARPGTLGGIACTRLGDLWIGDPDQQAGVGIFRYDAEGAFLGKIGGEDLSRTERIAGGPGGELAALDPSNRIVRCYDAHGWLVARFGERGDQPAQFDRPADIAFAPDGSLWVVDAGLSAAKQFRLDGTFLTAFGRRGRARGEMDRPAAIAAWDDRIATLEEGSDRVQLFHAVSTSRGQSIVVFGDTRNAPEYLKDPKDVARGPDGSIAAIADRTEILIVSAEGQRQARWDLRGDGNGKFDRIERIDCDPAGSLWALDGRSGAVQRLRLAGNADGTYYLSLPSDEENPVQQAKDIACDGLNRVYVLDPRTPAIHRFAQ